MTTNENDEQIDITLRTYVRYYSEYYGIWFFICALTTMSCVVAGRIGSDYTIG